MANILLRASFDSLHNPYNQDLELKVDIDKNQVKEILSSISTTSHRTILDRSIVLTKTLEEALFYILSNNFAILDGEDSPQLANMMGFLRYQFTTERFEKKNILELIQSIDIEEKDQILRNIKKNWELCSSEPLSDFLTREGIEEGLIGEVRELEHNG